MKILILGAGVDQIQMIKKAKKLGYVVYVADKNKDSVGLKYADVFVDIDPKDDLSLEAFIKDEGISGICTMASNLLPRYVSLLAERCGLRAIPYKSSLLATDKNEFKKIFKNVNIPIVEGGMAKNKDDAIKLCEELQFPIIFKPTDGSGCKGINIIRGKDQIESCFEDSLVSSQEKTVLIEKFLGDSLVFGVESIINNGETFIIGIADKIVKSTPSISTLGVTMPTTLKDRDIENVEKIVKDIHQTLGMNMGASHIDFIFDNGVPKVIDIGPRLAGGPLIFELIYKIKNIDMITYVIEQSLGEVPNPTIKENNLGAVSLHFFSPINGELIAYDMPRLYEGMTSSFRRRLGDYLRNEGSNVDRIGYLTCVDSSIAKAKSKIIDIIRNTDITIKKDDGNIVTLPPVLPSEFL